MGEERRIALIPRFVFLKESQNPDGGWGYFAGKASWLEPTVYAALALHADPTAGGVVERAWTWMRSLQRPDGAWRPTAKVPDPHWVTALCVSWHCVRGVYDESFRRGLEWLLEVAGAEGEPLMRVVHFLKPSVIEHDASLRGWPWHPGASSWVEPTAHALVALKKARHKFSSAALRLRVNLGERMLLDRRCRDGAWNYGSRRVLGEDLPSYSETTALGLLGLQGNPSLPLQPSLNRAMEYWHTTNCRLGRAWLSIVLQNYGVLNESPPPQVPRFRDVMLVALEALAGPGGARQLLAVEAS